MSQFLLSQLGGYERHISKHGDSFFFIHEPVLGIHTTRATTERSFKEGTMLEYFLSEGGQNSRDAGSSHVTITLCSVLREKLAEVGFDQAVGHAEAAGYDVSAARGEKIRCIRISDNGCGLNHQTYENFARNTGKSNKSGNSGGRHGMGRIALLMPSKARVLYGLSVCKETGWSVFVGMSITDTHQFDGADLKAEGIFARIEDGNAVPPTGDDAYALARSIGINREPGQSGLDLFIPAIDNDDFRIHPVMKLAIRQQLAAIAMGRLCVEIIDEDTGQSEIINRDTIRDKVLAIYQFDRRAHWFATQAPRLLDMFDEMQKSAEFKPLQVPSPAEIDSDTRNALRDLYEDNGTVSVTYPVQVTHRDRGVSTGWHNISLRRSPGTSGVAIFLRDTIQDVKDLGAGNPNIVVSHATGDDLASLLGDSENPSHDKWLPRNAEEKGWINPAPAILAFTSGHLELARQLQTTDNRPDFGPLARIFSAPSSASGPQRRPFPTLGGEDPEKVDDMEVKQFSKTMLLAKAVRRGDAIGIKLKLNKAGKSFVAKQDESDLIRLITAYPSASSSKIKSRDYVLGDYDLSQFNLDFKGADSVSAQENEIKIRGITPDFNLTITGPFDARRDFAFEIARND